ncbi:MAG: hypothetical protein JNM48_06950 [Rhodospirillales bacterium]|nr:hypothetical protein [Rhodospirillales bacterium]
MRLEKAHIAFRSLLQTTTFEDVNAAWSDFLIASHGIYTKLEQGAKSSQKSTYWFGKKKCERKQDPLLNYLHHARNSDEHRLDPITFEEPAQVYTSGDTKGRVGEAIIGNQITGGLGVKSHAITLRYSDGGGVSIKITNPQPKLARVKNYNVYYDPPLSHLGSSLEDSSLIRVAELGLLYFDRLVAEAEALVE